MKKQSEEQLLKEKEMLLNQLAERLNEIEQGKIKIRK
jgi:hypothetical protein